MSDERSSAETGEVRTRSRTRQPEAAAPETPAAPPAPPKDAELEKTDDPEPERELFKMKRQRALADINKPIEAAAEAIWSTDADKVKARTAIEQAYKTAARKRSNEQPEGELRARYRHADDKFIDAAADMLRSGEHNRKESRLTQWINTYLTGKGEAKVRAKLRQRTQVETRLMSRLGEREKRRQTTTDDTKRWEKAFGRWSAPDKEINAQIASYADRIDQLNADINTNVGNNRDQAIFSFWFEVAPAHLQLRPDAVSPDNAPGLDQILTALKEFSGMEDNYKSGSERDDGTLYLIDPERLANKREDILQQWQKAAELQADAEAAYATRPDAAADLKPRHDKLRDDGWIKDAKELLAAPKA